jgi:hypothetical protein
MTPLSMETLTCSWLVRGSLSKIWADKLEHSQHAAPQQTLHCVTHPDAPRLGKSQNLGDCSEFVSDCPRRRYISLLYSSTMTEIKMESEEVLMARFEELSVLETEFEDVEVQISE